MLRELVVKELVLLGLLGVLGSGLTMQLRAAAIPGGRLLLAPAFGLAVACALLVTVNFFIPLRTTLWTVLVPLCVMSVIAAVRAHRRPGWELGRQDFHGLLVAAVLVVAGLLLYSQPLDARMSPGPVSYGIFDSPEYVTFYRGFAEHTNRQPLSTATGDYGSAKYDGAAWPPTWDLTLRVAWGLKWQHSGSNALPAAVAAGLSWRPWRTQAPFMLVLLLACSVGAAGLARAISRHWWPALLAGAATGGSTLYSLQADGSQALMAGIAMVTAVLALSVILMRSFSWTVLLLLGLTLAGIQSAYPEILPFCVGGLGLAVVADGLRSRSRRTRPLIRRALVATLLLGAACLLLAPRSAFWTIEYYRLQLAGEAGLTPGNIYTFNTRGLLSWLLQTRDFYEVAFGAPGRRHGALLDLALPVALLLGPVLVFVLRRGAGRTLLAFAVVALVYAAYARYSVDCTYCEQRTLLPLAPLIAVALWAGIAEICRHPGRLRIAGTILGTVAALASGTAMIRTLDRVQDNGVMASPRLTTVLDGVARIDGPINLEGFGAVPYEAWAEQPTTYEAVREATSERVSTAAAANEYGGFHYSGTRAPADDSFDPQYEYVLSRFAAVQTGREEILRSGPMLLSRRAYPFDVTIARGVATAPERIDPGGTAFVQDPQAPSLIDKGALQLWVSAASAQPAFVRLVLAGPPVTRLAVTGSTVRPTTDGRVEVCAPVPGTGSLRILDAPVAPVPAPPVIDPATGRYRPSQDIRVDASGASGRPCQAPARPGPGHR